MPGDGQSTISYLGQLIFEFLVLLLKVLWLTAVGIVKTFLPTQKKNVSKEIVLVTGAGSGIGRLMALEFAKLGATVVLWDIDTNANESVCSEIQSRGGKASAYTCDLSRMEDIYETAAKVKQAVGSVTVLVNNAGIVTGKKFFNASDTMIDLTFRVNTVAHFWTIKAFVPDMISRNHGHIITIASSAGLFGVSGLMDYCASKFGAVGINEALSVELDTLKCTGIHTTCVCPYFINTGMFDGVKTRFPLLLPILSPQYAVDKIMAAYHSDQTILMMPRLLYLFYCLQTLFPKSAILECGKFFGVTKSMDSFRGRPVQKKD